jgi:hypothetical protein
MEEIHCRRKSPQTRAKGNHHSLILEILYRKFLIVTKRVLARYLCSSVSKKDKWYLSSSVSMKDKWSWVGSACGSTSSTCDVNKLWEQYGKVIWINGEEHRLNSGTGPGLASYHILREQPLTLPDTFQGGTHPVQ